jgi:hypothetical protein
MATTSIHWLHSYFIGRKSFLSGFIFVRRYASLARPNLFMLQVQYSVTASHDQKLARTEKRVPMKVILFGATGMVGQGVLRECLLDRDVERVLTVVRSPTGQQRPKLREIARTPQWGVGMA